MNTFLFFDDWLLESYVDLERCWAAAEPVSLPADQGPRLARAAIVLDSKRQRFLAWAKDLAGNRAALLASDDGLRWTATGDTMTVHPHQNFPFETGWFYDRWDRNPARRFKLVGFPYPRGIEGGPGVVGCSADGARWRWLRRAKWFNRPNGSDTSNQIFFNPLAKRWCVICRRYNTDRRVAMVESADLLTWTEPRVIVHPDAGDPPVLQFYGMAPALYEDEYFVGAIQCYHVPMFDQRPWQSRIKMQGAVDGQLVYSYDGQHWLRSDRSALVARGEPGTPGGACVYPHAIITHPDPRQGIFIYSLGTAVDHGGPPGGSTFQPVPEHLLLHRLRRDGFVYLRPRGGAGLLTTRVIVPRRPELTLNYCGPAGETRVQVCEPSGKVIADHSFDDCRPLADDELSASVRWKRKRDLAALVGRPIRLQVRLFDARLYAIRLDCGLWYTNTPEPIDDIA